MICVDTSVWISYFRGKDQPLVVELNQLLDESEVALPSPIWIELLSGASAKELPRLRKLLSALPRYYPTRKTWTAMEAFIQQATKAGHRFGFGDLLIGAISNEANATLWSLDSDFSRMAKLKFVTLR